MTFLNSSSSTCALFIWQKYFSLCCIERSVERGKFIDLLPEPSYLHWLLFSVLVLKCFSCLPFFFLKIYPCERESMQGRGSEGERILSGLLAEYRAQCGLNLMTSRS